VYSYLYKNIIYKQDTPYRYDKTSLDFTYTRRKIEDVPVYVSINRYHLLEQYFDKKSFWKYRKNKFLVYDHVQRAEGEDWNFEEIKQAFDENRNVAFVASDMLEKDKTFLQGENTMPHGDIIKKNSDQFQVLKYDSNSIKLKTNFKQQKFLVYNDNFHLGWQAFINDKKIDIFLTNVTFKGIWVPAGKNIIVFRFGAKWQYILNYLLMGIFYCLFLYIIRTWFKAWRNNPV